MARPLRVHIPGTCYHVLSRGNARQRIFLDDRDYRGFLRRLATAADRFDVRCLAYCLMPNHFHLLLAPQTLPLSRMMQQLNSSYAQAFNRRHDLVGHVLQGRFKALLVDNDVYLLRVLRYIVLNPVTSGLVRDPGAWRWSSYRATAGMGHAATFLAVRQVWDTFDPFSPKRGRRLFETFVGGSDPVEAPHGCLFVGSCDLAKTVAPLVLPHKLDPDIAWAERFAVRPPVEAVLAAATDEASLNRRMHDAYFEHGYTLREIGACVGQHTSTVWKRIHRVPTTRVAALIGRNTTRSGSEARPDKIKI